MSDVGRTLRKLRFVLLFTVAEVLGYPFSLACMDGRAGDRWTVKPSSVQPGYTLVGALWVRLGERGQYLQASWLVISSHLSCMLVFFGISWWQKQHDGTIVCLPQPN